MLDFDEILININNPQIKKYLAESIKSYAVGNYRSAIISVWIAAMFDLVKKFEILVAEREPTALEEWKKLKPKIEEHKNWECELIGKAKSVGMLSIYEADTLTRLSQTRNRYAHPSFDDVGTLFDPTPEEVRYFIRTLYDIALSQPAQLGAFYVNQLKESIKEANYFSTKPSTISLEQNRDEVVQKLKIVNSKQLPRLIKQLFTDLANPNSEDHKINILCFITNSWDYGEKELSLQELSQQITTSWDEYLNNNHRELNPKILESLLCYPNCFNLLSEKTCAIIESNINDLMINSSPEHNWIRSSLIFSNFLSYADVIPLAALLLKKAPAIVSLDRLIKQHSLYLEELGEDLFSDTFGIAIFEETRKALKTRNGYIVNPVLSTLRSCKMWNIVDSQIQAQEDKYEFAGELVDSLCSHNWETMNLLRFDNQNEISEHWSEIILNVWTDKLGSNNYTKECFSNYINQYLGLIYNHNTKKAISYSRTREGIEILDNSVSINSNIISQLQKLEKDNVDAWAFLMKILVENQDVINSEELKGMVNQS
jgi:hypothetical protein